MIKSFKVKIYPDKNQSEKIISFCNASRYSYNWALAYEIKNYEENKTFISGYELTTIWTQFKKQEENQWLKEISGRATKIAILNATKAFENFFKKRAKFPKFKKKGKSEMICATHEGTLVINSTHCRLEKLGWIKLGQRNYIPFGNGVKYFNPKISYDNINFWLSVSVEIDDIDNSHKPKTNGIGIDLGIKTLATISDGTINQKPNLKKYQKRLKRLQKQASRLYQLMINESKRTKTKFIYLPKSKNLINLEKEINKLYIKIKNILTTNIHEFTTHLIKNNPEFICIEDLNVTGMRKNKHLSQKINEVKFAEIRRQLEYKGQWYNVSIIIADRWFPSSKICSCCGNIKDKLSLSERVYNCECGFSMNRDKNAAINLKNYGANELALRQST